MCRTYQLLNYIIDWKWSQKSVACNYAIAQECAYSTFGARNSGRCKSDSWHQRFARNKDLDPVKIASTQTTSRKERLLERNAKHSRQKITTSSETITITWTKRRSMKTRRSPSRCCSAFSNRRTAWASIHDCVMSERKDTAMNKQTRGKSSHRRPCQ